MGMSYAESDDGFVWRKRRWGCQDRGHDTNILSQAIGRQERGSDAVFYECFGVSLNRFSDDPARVFILAILESNGATPGPGPKIRFIAASGAGWVSRQPDGIHWTPATPLRRLDL
jgi:hypothetical protein